MQIVENCEKCPLLCEKRHNIVNGTGPVPCDYMFIGEAPGEDEDLAGEPFVGGAGRTLNSMLYNAGINRKSVYITNVCRCRPPKNRQPTLEEIQNCLPFLMQEIRLVRPKFLIALGATAINALTFKDLHYRGMFVESQIFEHDNIPVLCCWHPSYIQRNGFGTFYSVGVWDFKKLSNPSKYLQKWDTTGYLVNPSYDKIQEYLNSAMPYPCAVDIETAGGDKEDSEKGLNPFTDKIIGIGFCFKPGYALSISGKHLMECLPLIKAFLEKHPQLIIHTRGSFDNTFLYLNGIKMDWYWNTTTGMYCIHTGFPRDLEFLRSLYTHIPPYKYRYKNPSLLGEIDLGVYNCTDVDATLLIHNSQKEIVPPEYMEWMMEQERAAMMMRIRGVRLDQDKLIDHYAMILPQMDALEAEFAEINIDLNSSAQVSDFMYKELGLKPTKKASEGKTRPSSDERQIQIQMAKLDPDSSARMLLKKILDYRGIQKIASTYCKGIYKRIHSDGKVHPDWVVQGTDTGRWACKDPNLQNMPPDMRDIVIASPGKVFLYADYNRIEVWVAAIMSGDKELLAILEGGIDIHGEVQKEIAKAYPPITRLQAKAVEFGIFYGRGADDIANEFNISKDLSQIWIDMFFNRFHALKHFLHEELPKQMKDKGYVKTFFGRRKYTDKVTEAMNGPIQGTASEICNRAIVKLHKLGFNLVINQHDSIMSEEDNGDRFEEFVYIMEHSAPELRPIFKVEGGVGEDWYSLSVK